MRTAAVVVESLLTATEAEEARVLTEVLEAWARASPSASTDAWSSPAASANTTASSVVARVANATLAVAKISAAAANQSGGLLALPVDGTEAEVAVPAALFVDLAVQEAVQEVALVVSVFDPPAARAMSGQEGAQEDAQEGAQVVEVKASASVNLVDASTGRRISVSDLSEPILVVLPVNSSVGLECAYWDEMTQTWATRGVTTAEPTPDGLLQCRTTHLTLFAGILRGFVSTYECSQGAELFNAEAIAMMLEGDWHRSTGAVLLWIVLSALSAGLLFSRCLDLKRERDGSWSDEHFLIPIGTENDAPPATDVGTPAGTESTGLEGSTDGDGPDGEDVEEKPPRRRILVAIIWCPAMALCACFRWMRESLALREALDDVLSNWIAHFSEIRDTLEGFWEGLELFAQEARQEDGGWAVALIHAMMRSLLLSTARRQACSSMQLSGNDVAFVMREEDLVDILISRHERSKTLSADEPGVPLKALPDGGSPAQRSSWARGLSVVLEPEADNKANLVSISEARASLGLVPDACILTAGLGSEASSMYSAPSQRTSMCSQRTSMYSACSQRTSCSQRTLGREEGWGQLHEDVNDHLDMHITKTGLWRSVPCAIARIFMVENPVGKSMLKSVFMTSALRFFLFVLDIFGALLMTTAFFQASGNVVGRKAARARCGKGFAGTWDQVGRMLAIGVGSLVVAAIPVMLLSSLHGRRLKKLPYEGSPEWQRQLHVWRIEDLAIWVLGSACLGACTFFTCLFLANVSEQDTRTWAISAGLTISLNCVIIPLIISIMVPVLAAALLSLVSVAKRTPKAELIRRSHVVLKNGNLTPPLVHI